MTSEVVIDEYMANLMRAMAVPEKKSRTREFLQEF